MLATCRCADDNTAYPPCLVQGSPCSAILCRDARKTHHRLVGLQPLRIPENAPEGVPEPAESLGLVPIPEIPTIKHRLQVVCDLRSGETCNLRFGRSGWHFAMSMSKGCSCRRGGAQLSCPAIDNERCPLLPDIQANTTQIQLLHSGMQQCCMAGDRDTSHHAQRSRGTLMTHHSLDIAASAMSSANLTGGMEYQAYRAHQCQHIGGMHCGCGVLQERERGSGASAPCPGRARSRLPCPGPL